MIFGIGVDIAEISRLKKAVQNERFKIRVFTAGEIQYCEGRGGQSAASYAARFAAKEAVLKAFGTGLRGGALTEIDVYQDALGCPQIRLTGFFAAWAAERRIDRIYISLSHAREYAVAQAICWRGLNESGNGAGNAAD